MRSRLLSHPGLKIASLVLAFLLWLVIINVNDPQVTRTLSDVPVNITNASYVESMGLSYKIATGFDKVSVTLRGNRSVIEPLSEKDITATADLTQIVNISSDPVMVPVTVTAPGGTSAEITATPGSIQITLEEMVSKNFVMTASRKDTKPANGYQVGDMSVNPEKITIRGPGSVIDKIDHVEAQVDLSGLAADADLKPQIKVIDKNGEELSATEMSYLTLSLSSADVTVHVTLYSVVTNIALDVTPYGSPGKGYQVGTVTATPSTLSLVGSKEALAGLQDQGNMIIVSAESEAVNVSGATSDLDVKVDIEQFLPQGISLADGVSSTVVVSVQILPYNSKSFSVETKNITVNGLPQGYHCVFLLDKIEVKVSSTDENLNTFDASRIQASVDLTGLAVGTQNVPVTVALPDGYVLAGNVTADVTISQQTTTAQPQSSSPAA
ncbi:MAG TPA: CdaR family protein [Lachnospiraceae bacterium]|nr:CdaR family protein [Lachnospiraceae bacterium]